MPTDKSDDEYKSNTESSFIVPDYQQCEGRSLQNLDSKFGWEDLHQHPFHPPQLNIWKRSISNKHISWIPHMLQDGGE